MEPSPNPFPNSAGQRYPVLNLPCPKLSNILPESATDPITFSLKQRGYYLTAIKSLWVEPEIPAEPYYLPEKEMGYLKLEEISFNTYMQGNFNYTETTNFYHLQKSHPSSLGNPCFIANNYN